MWVSHKEVGIEGPTKVNEGVENTHADRTFYEMSPERLTANLKGEHIERKI